MTDCPTVEELSEFIDGKLPYENRESVAAHLGNCEVCYSIVTESLAIREESNNQSRARYKKHLAYSLPAALAVAAVLLIVFRILQPAHEFTGKPERRLAHREAMSEKPVPKRDNVSMSRSYSGELAGRIAGKSAAAPLAGAVGNQFKPETSYGFSSFVTLEKAAFRIGSCLVDLELALKAKDKEKIEIFAKRLIELLKPIESSYGLIPSIADRNGPSDDSGGESTRYEGLSRAVEALFENKPESVLLKFGAWVEAAGLAAESRDAAFFQPAVVSAFKRDLEKSGVPVGTLNNLSQLEAIMSSGRMQTDEFRSMARLLADIKEMF